MDREATMTEWNDRSLDERFLQIDQRFDQVERKVDEGFARVDRRFEQFDLRFDALQQMLIRMAWTYGIGMLAFAGALLGLIAAKF